MAASAAAAIAAGVILGSGGASAAVSCTNYASPTGSDTAAGTKAAPFKTVTRLASSLNPGETGCLIAGTYVEDVRVPKGRAPGSPIVLASDPSGSRATVRGRLYVPDAANDVVVTNLTLDGRNAARLPSPTINGDRVSFLGDEVTNFHTGICFSLGSTDVWGRAVDTVIDGNRIHDCGKLPSTNLHHGIYVDATDNARITNNYIYNNTDRGVQLYPDAQGTLVANNVIDGNGEGVIFSGEATLASNNNVVRDNLITNSNIRYNVESWWPGAVGTGNQLNHNCVYGGRQGNIQTPNGFTATNNVIANPLYRNRTAKDFRLRNGSPCAGMGPQAASATTTRAATSTTAQPTTRIHRLHPV